MTMVLFPRFVRVLLSVWKSKVIRFIWVYVDGLIVMIADCWFCQHGIKYCQEFELGKILVLQGAVSSLSSVGYYLLCKFFFTFLSLNQPETFVKVRPRCEAPRRDMIYPTNYTPCRYVRISCLRGNPIAIFFVQVYEKSTFLPYCTIFASPFLIYFPLYKVWNT